MLLAVQVVVQLLMDIGDTSDMSSTSDDQWEQFIRFNGIMEGGATIYKNSKGEDCYKVIADTAAGTRAIVGLDMVAGGYASYFESLGYDTSVGSLIPVDVVNPKKEEDIKTRFYGSIEKYCSAEGFTLTKYQMFALTARAFNCGCKGAFYSGYGVESFKDAYKKYWKQSRDDKFKKSNKADLTHKLYTNSMFKPNSSGGEVLSGLIARREWEFRLFQCGWYHTDTSHSSGNMDELFIENSSGDGGTVVENAIKIHKYVREHGYTYGYIGGTIPEKFSKSKVIDCAGFVSWVLYESGNKTFKSGQEYAFVNTYKSHGLVEVSEKDIQPGDILVYATHVEIAAKVKNGKVTRVYDCGQDEDIMNPGTNDCPESSEPHSPPYRIILRQPGTSTENGTVLSGTPGKEGRTTVGGTKIKTYTSVKGKRTYILYKQTEGPWSTKPYGSGNTYFGTVGYCGCPTTACATMFSGFKKTQKLTPEDYRQAIYPTSVGDGVNRLVSKYGYSFNYHGYFNKNEVIEQLKKGNPVVYHVNSASIYTNNEHWMALLDINDNGTKVYVATGASVSASSGWYDINTAFYTADFFFTL